MAMERTDSYLKDSLAVFRYYKRLGENAMAQCPDAGLIAELDAQSNSIAIIVKHLHGNMLSRWTDFLTSDGEKEWRERDCEVENEKLTKDQMISMWQEGG